MSECDRGGHGFMQLGSRLGALACAAAVAHATPPLVVYVDRSAPEAGQDGTSWESAFRDLQDAIASAKARMPATPVNVEIRVAQGVYKPDRGTLDRTATFHFDLPLLSATRLSLLGSFAGLQGADPDAQDFVATRTVLSGDLAGDDLPEDVNRSDNSFRIAHIALPDGGALVRGVTFRGAGGAAIADQPVGGAGLRIALAGVHMMPALVWNCSFEDNSAPTGDGAGLWIKSMAPNIADSTFVRNRTQSGSGGAVYLESQQVAYPSVEGCEFEKNSATNGGAFASAGYERVWRCTFADNRASVAGGAYAGVGEIRSSLFLRNSAGASAGAVMAKRLTCEYSTFAGNTAPSIAAISSAESLSLTGIIAWDNTNADASRPVIRGQSLTSTPRATSCLVQSGSRGFDIIGSTLSTVNFLSSADPQFIRPGAPADPTGQWRNWNYRLKVSSPVRARGTKPTIYDLDGHSLPYALSLPGDIGAYFAIDRPCPADLDLTYPARVDEDDFAIFIDAYNIMVAPPADPRADFNRDGIVDDADFSIFAVAYQHLLCP
ncbi:MAG: hypothetical protein U0570_03430 [Phycisphaerales bacterium]